MKTITIGRYLLHRQIARGGMATIHLARLVGDVGFSRIVAAKRLHPELADNAELVAMLLDEARIASKIHHRNVVPVLDVVNTDGEVVLVQEYVHGAPLQVLLRAAYDARTHVPINIAVAIASQVLTGLHAVHHAVDELGTPLDVVHRDVSPQNVMIASDGTARLLDFGIAKTASRAYSTRDGVFKGKLGYSAPEHIRGQAVRQSDVYSAAVVLWELIVGRRMFGSVDSEAALVAQILAGAAPRITDALAGEREGLGANRWKLLVALEPIIARGLAVDLAARWPTAAAFDAALATAATPASPAGVAAWLRALAKPFLDDRDRALAEEEASWRRSVLGVVAADPAPTRIARPRRSTSAITWIGAGVLAASLAFVGFLAHDSARKIAPAAAPARTATSPSGAAPARSPPPPPSPRAEPPVATPMALPARPLPPRRHPPAPRRATPHALPEPPPPPEPAPAAADDCATPYYYDGAKKVFKPQCL